MRSLARSLVLLAVLASLVLTALPALAHVTVRADTTAAGGFAKYTVRVPSESEDAATTRVEIRLPRAFAEARYQPVAGWDIDIEGRVLTIDGGRIEPGQFQEFAFTAQNPGRARTLRFPAIQVYDDGEEVRWVGAADSDEPAPTVRITRAGGPAMQEQVETPEVDESAHDDEGDEDPADEPTDAETETADDLASAPASDGGGGSNVLSIIALIAGLLGLGLGGAAFARTRNTTGV